jgi:uncharacterized protein YdaU (DUF1376 family)
MNFYKHYIGDFQRDTSHLTMTERGAYLSLIHHYYATETCLPRDHSMLCRIAGAMTKPERDAVKVAAAFFEIKPEGLWHKRIEAELEKTDSKRDTNQQIALAREAKKRAAKDARTEHESCTKRSTNLPRTEHENSTIPEPDTRLKQSSVERDGVIDKPCPVIQINQSIPQQEKFAIGFDWTPSIEFEKSLPPDLVTTPSVTLNDLQEFIAYRISTGEKFTQQEWELRYLKNLQANKRHRGQA